MAAETALKFVLVGDSNVGKSQLSLRFCKEKFNISSQSTVGIEFATRTICLNEFFVKAQLWDTAGQERFESMTRAYFRNAVGAVLVYDVTKRQSFENMKNKWISQLQEFGHQDMYIIIIGNKCDVEQSQHAVHAAEAAEFAESVGLDFVETSAKSGLNVDTAFRRAVVSVARRLPHIKKSIQQAGLPEGWLRCPPVGGNGAPLFQNMWTGEVDGACPTAPARTGMLVNSRSLRDNDEDVVFRDSSIDYPDTGKHEKGKRKVLPADREKGDNDQSDSSLSLKESNNKSEGFSCFFAQCIIL